MTQSDNPAGNSTDNPAGNPAESHANSSTGNQANERDGLGFLLADSVRMIRKVAAAKFETEGMTLAQAKALLGVKRFEGIRQVDLAEYMEIQPITLARLLDQLAEAGLIERRKDPSDRRAFRLYLTPEAAPVVARFKATSSHWQREILSGLDDAEVETLFKALDHIRARLSAMSR